MCQLRRFVMSTKRKYIYFYIALFAFVSSLAAEDTKSAEASANDTLTVIARLLEIPGTMPPNDLYNYVYIMKYRILSVVKGEYKEKEIYIGHYNPLVSRKAITGKMASVVKGSIEKFTVGSKHQLKLISPIEKVWKDAVEDEYIEIEQDKFFAVYAEEVK